MADIVLYKLTTGEEIIAKSKGTTLLEGDDDITLEDVRVLVVQPTGNGQYGVAMVPWLASAPEGEVKVSKSAIIGKLQNGINKQLEDAYLQQTSGIELAGGMGLHR